MDFDWSVTTKATIPYVPFDRGMRTPTSMKMMCFEWYDLHPIVSLGHENLTHHGAVLEINTSTTC